MHHNGWALGAVLAILAAPDRAAAQPDTQLWSEITLTWIKDHRWTLGLDTEPKVLVSAGRRPQLGDAGFHALARVHAR
jgi:hypothetical protein